MVSSVLKFAPVARQPTPPLPEPDPFVRSYAPEVSLRDLYFNEVAVAGDPTITGLRELKFDMRNLNLLRCSFEKFSVECEVGHRSPTIWKADLRRDGDRLQLTTTFLDSTDSDRYPFHDDRLPPPEETRLTEAVILISRKKDNDTGSYELSGLAVNINHFHRKLSITERDAYMYARQRYAQYNATNVNPEDITLIPRWQGSSFSFGWGRNEKWVWDIKMCCDNPVELGLSQKIHYSKGGGGRLADGAAFHINTGSNRVFISRTIDRYLKEHATDEIVWNSKAPRTTAQIYRNDNDRLVGTFLMPRADSLLGEPNEPKPENAIFFIAAPSLEVTRIATVKQIPRP